MTINSKIEWTDHTFNPWRGCTKVAAGCTNCYADTLSKRNPGTLGIWGPNGTRVVASEAMWHEPVKWNNHAREAKAWIDHVERKDSPPRHRVFCASLADVFEDWQGPMHVSSGENLWLKLQDGTERIGGMDDARCRLFALIDDTPHLDWLLLTKRPENIRRMWPYVPHTVLQEPKHQFSGFRRNCWLGTSIATQEDADKNIPELLKCRDLAPVLFVSAEPLLGPVDIRKCLPGWCDTCEGTGEAMGMVCYGGVPVERIIECPDCPSKASGIDWVIVGGESGHNARPCNIEWIRSIRDQCADAGVPCFIKQLGAYPCLRPDNGVPQRILSVRNPKGGDWDEWPEDLRVRQFPEVRV